MKLPRPKFGIATRVSISLVLLSVTSYLLAAEILKIRNIETVRLQRRISIAESLAISCSLFAERREEARIQANILRVVERNSDIASACIRLSDGRLLGVSGSHEDNWVEPDSSEIGLDGTPQASFESNCMFIPISSQQRPWGRLELCFQEESHSWLTLLRHPLIGMGALLFVMNMALFRWYLGRILQYLNPTTAVPEHVRSTLDTFAEGVLVLDNENRIVIANNSFARNIGHEIETLQGKNIDSFAWKFDSEHAIAPWVDITIDRPSVGRQVRFHPEATGQERCYLVNASVIVGSDGKARGTVASFDDVTAMERKRDELRAMLHDLQRSREELSKRNTELHLLATRDALTGCLNRRTFYETFNAMWNESGKKETPLCCLMVDIDHFKSINDRFGHSMGDEVLRAVGRVLLQSTGSNGIAARYGGEEFCVLVPDMDLSTAYQFAEQLRRQIAALEFEQLSVTTSIGVSANSLGAQDTQELLDQADKCLYVAKRNGRNQVVWWNDVPVDLVIDESQLSRSGEDASIPYPAVTSLISALAYRHPDTAAHSMRVAELAVLCARGLMPAKDAYVLEIGALLHDIGKIGVPDAILLKPGALSKEEWTVMHIHDRIGMEIIEASFANRQLLDVVRYHHATFGGSPDAPELPIGEAIPLGARIVMIADAFDAMTSDRVYRKGRSKEEAFAELRRCAGRQFDPQLVEKFIEAVRFYRPTKVSVASKYTALQIGLHLEKLTEAVDAQDIKAIKTLAARLEATASSSDIPEIREIASQISSANEQDLQAISMLEMTQDLIMLCRSTQRAYSTVELQELTNFGNESGNGEILARATDFSNS